MKSDLMMMVARVFSAAAVVVVLAGAAPALVDDSPPAAEAQVAQLLTNMGALRQCTTNCEFDCASSDQHANYTHAGGNDGGEIHSCAWSSNSCRDHSCSVSMNEQLSQLQTLVATLDGTALRRLDEQHALLFINRDRHAVQILGCEDQIVLTMNLTRAQASEL